MTADNLTKVIDMIATLTGALMHLVGLLRAARAEGRDITPDELEQSQARVHLALEKLQREVT